MTGIIPDTKNGVFRYEQNNLWNILCISYVRITNYNGHNSLPTTNKYIYYIYIISASCVIKSMTKNCIINLLHVTELMMKLLEHER